MDTDKIKVLGAGLNAKEPNSEVSFHVTKPEKAVKVDSYAYKKQDAKAVHVRLVKIATSSNASKKLQFAVELAIEKEDGTENLVSGLKAPIMVTVLLPEDYLEIRKESDKLYGPDGKKIGTELDDDEISLFITRLGTFTVKGSGSSSNPAPGRRSGGRVGTVSSYTQSGTWMPEEAGWKYRYINGSYPKNIWLELKWNGATDWYRFDENGYMVTGWFHDGTNWYYRHNTADGRRGHMYLGGHQIDGKWYYFSQEGNGTKGAMLYNTSTPDGYVVDEHGVWVE